MTLSNEPTDIRGYLNQPLGASTSDIHVLNSTNTGGNINIVIDDIPFSIPDENKPHFSAFSKFTGFLQPWLVSPEPLAN